MSPTSTVRQLLRQLLPPVPPRGTGLLAALLLLLLLLPSLFLLSLIM
jgi:hypothetical protein